MSLETVSPAQVAMLVQGEEVYGIGTVEKLYAEIWPDLTFVCLGPGPLNDWLRARQAKVELIEGLVKFNEQRTLPTLARLPLVFRQAKRDATRIHDRLAGRGIRIIHAHWRPQQIMAGYLRRMGYKSVWHMHNHTSRTRMFGFGLRLNHRLARWGADCLIPVSDFIARNWRGSGVPIHTILNAATPLFAGPSELPLDGPVRTLVAGRLDTTKGHHVAIEAVAAARAAGCDVTLDVCGGPLENNPYADELRHKIAAAGMDSAMKLLGFCSDLRERHQQYHMGLHCTTIADSCSMWICEATVDGLPLVASATGGTPELVDDGVTGYLYPPGDPQTLAQRLIRLCGDRALLAKMRTMAFERGKQLFSAQRIGEETLAAYLSLNERQVGMTNQTFSR
jgi:glycosyltransferase involved in cell wall biosynthesis